MRLRRMWCCICTAVIYLSASAAADVFDHPIASDKDKTEALQRLSDNLAAQVAVRGDFVQEKFLSILDKPLHSRGSFSLSDEDVFVWQVEEPFAVSYRFSGRNLHRTDSHGEQLVRPSDDPMLYGFFAFFTNLFELSHADLAKMFDVYFQQQETRWVIGLQPKDSLLKKSVDAIVVEGSSLTALRGDQVMTMAITKVTIRESGGDYSHLLFSY